MPEGSNNPVVLVVDDAPDNIDLLTQCLRPTYRVKAALNGERALRVAASDPKPDLILLDVTMPDMDGYEVCRRLKSDPATSAIPVMFVTSNDSDEDERLGLEVGAVDYVTKPINPAIVLQRIRTHLALYDQQRALEQRVQARTQELVNTRMLIIQQLGRAAEFKDNETGLHVIRMSHYSRLIAEAHTQNKDWSELILTAAPMHDIGKIGIPDRILLKPGKLDEDEWKIMRKHPEMGAAIIGGHDALLLKTAREIALMHHEKWDGSGYPQGLRGDSIPLPGRIVAIADVFDALTTARPYKKAWTVEDAMKYIDEQSGTHFQPELVRVFHEVLPEALDIKAKYAETD